MRWRRQNLADLVLLAKDQFLPFILFWLAVIMMRFSHFGGLLSLAFVNGEWAVQFWLKAGYSYPVALAVCALCGNIDLVMWFWFFKRGRFLLEHKYPKAGVWFLKRFDPRQYDLSANDGNFILFLKRLVSKLNQAFKDHPNLGLFLMGITPFCGIILGVPSAVGYKVKNGYWVMALGNTIKIVVLGLIISQKIILLGIVMTLIIWILLTQSPKTENRV